MREVKGNWYATLKGNLERGCVGLERCFCASQRVMHRLVGSFPPFLRHLILAASLLRLVRTLALLQNLPVQRFYHSLFRLSVRNFCILEM